MKDDFRAASSEGNGGFSDRCRFLGDVVPTGVGPVLALCGLVTILVGGSLLELIRVDFWLGAWIVTVTLSIAAFEGTFRKWQRSMEVAEAGGTIPPALPDILKALISEGRALYEKVESDPAWGVVHQKSGLPDWTAAVTKVLDDEAPELAMWFNQMESPSRRPSVLPDDAKERFLVQFAWSIDRLADIEDIVHARSSEGHPEGEQRTRQLLLLDHCLQLVQEANLLRQQIPPLVMPMMPAQLEPEQANARIHDCAERLRSALVDAVGTEKAEELTEDAVVGIQPTVREGLDIEDVQRLLQRQQALQAAFRLDELALRP
jgi:hypothetical protein